MKPHKPHKQLYSLIKTLPCFDDSVVIEKIEAGQSSECFKVSTSNNETPIKKYFVKYNADEDLFDNELKVSKQASVIGLSPRVVYSDKNWLINEFIEGTTLDYCVSTPKEKISIALNLILKCHVLKASVPVLDIKAIINNIMLNDQFSSKQRKYIQLILNKLPLIKVTELSVCHGDVNFSNIIVDKDNAWLIDFECSCLAEKEFELAMFFAINLLNEDEQVYALNSYKQLNRVENVDTDKLSSYLLYSYLINGLWYIEKTKDNKLPILQVEIFYNQAFEQLSLFDRIYPNTTPLSDAQLSNTTLSILMGK